MRKLKVTELNRISVEEFKEAKKLPLVVVLDNVRSVYNVGSVFRTCDAFRIESIYLCGISAQPPQVELHKTALGAEETVEWRYFKDTLDAVRELQQQGYTVYAVEQAHDSLTLEQVAEQITNCPKTAVVLGHEVFGVQQQVIDLCHQCIEIPQFGTKHSMNVSVTAGIVMYRLANALRR